jgi:AcrR family transcriptional regulator
MEARRETVARTLDPAVHAVRRDVFVDAAQRLIQAKGYEQMSVQDVLDEAGASKGAFYHYFDSKSALLDGVIQRMVTDSLAALQPIVTDPNRSAVDKLNGLFAGMASWKSQRKELLLAVLRVWLSDDNAIVRDKLRRGVIANLTPVFTSIIRQGMAESSFTVTSADHAARVLVSLMLGANEHAGDLYVARQAGQMPFELIEGALAAYPEALERILGAPPGSLRMIDSKVLHEWYG